MNGIDYKFARSYHQSLLHTAEAARRASAGSVVESNSPYPGLRDRIYLWLGNILVAAGEHLRKQSAHSRLAEECA